MAKEGKKPIGKIILIVVVVLIAIGAIGSMGGKESSSSSDSNSSSEQATEQKEQEPYTIVDEAEDRSNQYAYKITGTLTNNTDSKKSYIQVEYVLYDADGNQVGTALANTNNLKAGGSWKYEASSLVDPSQVASWEREDVSGF